jgi:hypothetical protein
MSPIQELPIIRKEVPWKAVKMRKMKNEAKLGANAVPIEKAAKRIALNNCVHLLPYTCPNGPQNIGDNPMNSMYNALLALMMVPVVLYVAATSGTAASTVVDAMGARKEQKARTDTMPIFFPCVNLS